MTFRPVNDLLLLTPINTLRPRQNSRHFADDQFKPFSVNETVRIAIKISLNFIPKDPINNIPALIQIMAWRRPGDKLLFEPILFKLQMHICVTRPQWLQYMIWGTRSHKFTSYSKYSRNKWKTPKSWFLVHLWVIFYYQSDVICPALRLKSPAQQC